MVTNRGGYTNISYEHLTVLVADVPETPLTGPRCDFNYTSTNRIRVLFEEP